MQAKKVLCAVLVLAMALAFSPAANARMRANGADEPLRAVAARAPGHAPDIASLVRKIGGSRAITPQLGSRERRVLERELRHRLSAVMARRLDQHFFPIALGQAAPSVLHPGGKQKLRLIRRVNARLAEVRTAQGRRAVVQGSLPLFGVDPSGQTAPVDLSLLDTGTAWQPSGALVPVEIPKSATGAINFPNSVVTIQLANAASAAAAGQQDGDSIFYPNVDGADADTDAIVSPTEMGADISWVLRSPSSPKQLDLNFSMLPGWTLKPTSDGGVDIVDATGQVHGHVMPPLTTDAKGNTLQSKYVVKGSSTLETQVEVDSSQPVAYPILVDPSAAFGDFFSGSSDSSQQWWLDGYWSSSVAANFSAYNSNGSYEEWTGTTASYPASASAYYYHTEPAHTTAFGAEFFSIYNYAYTTSTGGYTGELAGINDSSPTSGQWNDSAGGQGYNSAILQKTSESNLGYQVFCVTEWTFSPSGICPTSTAYPGDTIVVPGIDVTGGAPKSAPAVAADGLSVYETDTVTPAAASITHTVAPGTWINPKANAGAASDQVAMTWSDSGGLGLQSEALTGSNVSSQSQSINCNGKHTSPCPTSSSTNFTYSLTGLPEGVNTISESATSLVGNVGSTSWTVDVDETAPTASVSCSTGGSWSNAASSTCTAIGSDPANSSNGTAGSGLANLQYQTQVNGGAWSAATSIASGGTFSVSGEGVTSVRAIAVDQAGNSFTSPSATVKLDRTAPTAALSCPGSGAYTNAAITCTITGSDPADASDGAAGSGLNQLQYQTQANGGSWSTPTTVSSGSQFSVNIEGIVNVRAIATDAAGNSSTTTNTVIKIDETPPTATVNCAGNGAWTNASTVSCTITGSDPANASNGSGGSGLASLQYETSTNGAAWSAPSAVASGAQVSVSTEGQTMVRAIAADQAGNTFTSAGAAVDIDQTEPNISISGSLVTQATTIPAGTDTLTITASDPTTTDDGVVVSAVSGVQSTSITLDGNSVGPAYQNSCSSTNCTQTISYNYSVTPGAHEVIVTSTDVAGNTSTYTYDFSGPPVVPAEPTESFDLTKAGLRLDGAASGDLSGSSVADIGDINGDGVEDYAIGAPHYNNGAGAVFVIYGQQDPATINLANLATAGPGGTSAGFEIDGATAASGVQPGDLAGSSVAGAGDVNGDGYSDFLIGAPRATTSNPTEARGSVYVVFGRPGMQGFNLANIATAGPNGGPAGFQIEGPQPSLLDLGSDARPFGYALNGAGNGTTATGSDVNGDGLDDIVVGDSDMSGSNLSYGAGAAWVIFGKADGGTVDLSSSSTLGTEGYEIQGLGEGSNLGASVSFVGDQNGDGLADVAVAAPGLACMGRNNSGAAYVLYGKSDSNTISLTSGAPSDGYQICGNTGDVLGSSTSGHGLADVGDVSTDGIDDLAIGGNGGYVVFGQSTPNPGAVIDLATFNSNGQGYMIAPPGSGYTSGTNVFSVGDLNDDGTNDLAIADPTVSNSTGDAYVVYGKPDGATVNLAGLSATGASSGGELGFHVPAPAAGDQLGMSIIGISDATDSTGTGDDDLLFGTPGANNGAGANSGSTYVLDVPDSNDDPQTANSTTNQAFLAPHGYGLAFQTPCAWTTSACNNDPAATIALNWSSKQDSQGALATGRSMKIMKILVPFNIATPTNCPVPSSDAGSYTYGYQDPNADCGNINAGTNEDAATNADGTSPNTSNCGAGFGLRCFLDMVSADEKLESAPIAVDITLTTSGYGKTAVKPDSQTSYQSALEELVTYANSTLAAGDGGVHVRYWDAWNEPDNFSNEPLGNKSPQVIAANYALWANQVLATHALRATPTGPLKHGIAPLVGAPCTTKGPCTVVVGDFAAVVPHHIQITKYEDQMSFLRGNQDFVPTIWSYHGYDDTTTGADAANQDNPLADAVAMDKTLLDGQWKSAGHQPQIWMSEGGDALQNGGAPTADSGAIPTASNCSANGYTTALTNNITGAMDRFLALTSGRGQLAGGSSGLSAAQLTYAGKISVALYYELGAGGSGFPGEATDKACGFPLPDAPKADPGYTPKVGGGKFDSSLFESKFEAIEAAGTSGTVQIQPRLQYCLLEGLTGAAATTACPGSSIADPQSSYGNN